MKLVSDFIEDIWNNRRFERMCHYLHQDFIDHSLPTGFQNAAGLTACLTELNKNITHNTTIEKLTFEQNFVFVQVKIILSALSKPQDRAYAGKQDEMITGHRILALCDERIIGHWEFLADTH